MAKGLFSFTGFAALVLTLLPLHLECARQVSHATLVDIVEHEDTSRGVPSIIYEAIGNASSLVDSHLETVEAASEEAALRKQKATSMIQKKLAAVQAVKDQTAEITKKEGAATTALEKVKDASASHDKAGKDHAKAFEDYNKLKDDLAALKENITRKEEGMRQILHNLKGQIEALKKKFDEMSKAKDAAFDKVKDLNLEARKKGQLKKISQQEQADATSAVEQAQKELRELRAKLDTAATAATTAEAKDGEAENQLREAQVRVDKAKKTKDLLMAIRTAVRRYYASVDDLEDAMDGKAHHEMKEQPEAKKTLDKYNLMIKAFQDLHNDDPAVYKVVNKAVEEISKNANAHIRFICDIKKKVTDQEAEEHCLSGLWKKLGITQLELPA
mgnify:FL=1